MGGGGATLRAGAWVFGGCWCMAYHPEVSRTDAAQNRAGKERRVRMGRAHAALVLDESGTAQGWCQYGSPAKLPNIKHRREYDKDAPPRPDWRVTCFYVDKKHRGQSIARAALAGALGQIAQAGGERAEAISEVTAGRDGQGRFLFSATVERHPGSRKSLKEMREPVSDRGSVVRSRGEWPPTRSTTNHRR